jgi:hypothetical protein
MMKIKKRNKRYFWPVLSILAMVCLASCTSGGGNRLEVRIQVPDPFAVNFEKYDHIIYKDLSIQSELKTYNPQEEIRGFFLEDFPRIIDKSIEAWDNEKHTPMPANTLLITGKLKLVVKERSKIEEVEKEEGKGKKRSFVTVQHWDVILSILLDEAGTGKEIYQEEFNEKIADADPVNAKFNFEKLFYKITDRLVKQVTRAKRMQRRYLLN